MSMTKEGANYARHMDEVFEQECQDGLHDHDDEYLLYQEYCYLQEQEEKKKKEQASPLRPLFDGMAAAYQQLNNKH